MATNRMRVPGSLRAGAIALAAVAALLAGNAARAVPRVPASDSEIVESLPTVAGWSREERRLRRELVARPRDEAVALAAAQSYLDLARSQGDARYAGRALGVLQAWQPLTAATPNAILVMHATVAQFLHDFDGSERTLRMALASDPDNAQGWLTLATILRVRGRYDESDKACHSLVRLRQNLHAVACLAENTGLRGDHDAAQEALQALLDGPLLQDPSQAATRQWLLTTMAEIDELAGRERQADAAYRQALGASASAYDVLAYSDFLLHRDRPAEVLSLLKAEPRSDAVLLRIVMANQRLAAQKAPGRAQRDAAQSDVQELAARFEAAALRPGSSQLHAREQALFALDVQGDAQRALALARLDVQLQREPIDLLVFARAAVAAGDDDARREVKVLMQQIGLRDARVDAVLGRSA
jgi:Tfp pilus assembly protein PilF